MATVETPAQPRGRPRAFDPDAVLEAAMGLFWEQGYEATSISDIVEVTGLNKSSLYNTFGSKDDLYEAALTRYIELRIEIMTSVLTEGTAGLDDVVALFALVRTEMRSEVGRRGCLAVNMTTELGLREEFATRAAQRFRGAMRSAFVAALERAATAGEIEPSCVDAYADVLVSYTLGMSVLARGGATPEEFDAQFTGIQGVVEGWRRS